MRFLCLLILLMFRVLNVHSQTNSVADRYNQVADSLGEQNQNLLSAHAYLMEAKYSTMVPFKKQALVNAAYQYASIPYKDSALFYLDVATRKYGFANLEFLEQNSVMQQFRNEKQFKSILDFIRQKMESRKDLSKAIINTSDIDLFWKVYDQFKKDTTDGENFFIRKYFEKGSWALQEYYRIKTRNIGGIKAFVRNMNNMNQYYSGIRANTLKVKYLADSIRTIYGNLKEIYPGAQFPPLTFVMGGWSSGGTTTDYGLLVGADMYANNETTDKSELNAWQKRNSYLFSSLKYVVAHELIHAQQGGMKEDTILLSYVIREGMADFIGELISGGNANATLHQLVKGKEQRVWKAFERDMYLNKYSDWIANSSQETVDWPSDLGYWVGYMICKAYYNKAPDKKKAIQEMLHIQDYKRFYERSGVKGN